MSSTVFTETLSYTGDGLPATDTLVRPDFTDWRSYTYAPQSRRLTQEILNLEHQCYVDKHLHLMTVAALVAPGC